MLILSLQYKSISSQRTNSEVPIPEVAGVSEFAEQILDRYEIPGLSIAIQKNGEIIHRANYGFASLEHRVPITDESIFRVYSITKITVATTIFQLIEAQKLSITDPISKYLDDLPESWQNIQIKHLLTHSSGLPDMDIFEFQDLNEEEAKARVYEQRPHNIAGLNYEYNQTNFWLLHRIIEAVSDQKMEDVILSSQFPEAGSEVFFSSDSREIIPHRATVYFPFSTGKRSIEVPYVGEYLHAANGLNLTTDQLLKWGQRTLNNQFMSAETQRSMWRAYPYADGKDNFAYSWEIHEDAQGQRSFGFSGSLVTAIRIVPEDEVVIVFLANGMGQFFNIETQMSQIAAMVSP
ncbi:MAG: serine hydrolase domain-containing protein [Bacteroidota bacterium]